MIKTQKITHKKQTAKNTQASKKQACEQGKSLGDSSAFLTQFSPQFTSQFIKQSTFKFPTSEEMIASIVAYNKNCNQQLIKKAYDLCIYAHRDQKRKSGEPYCVHPIAVAEEIIKIGLDDDTIITALLHDTVEDTDVTYKFILENFSESVADLVDGVTKLRKIKFRSDKMHQAENFRKLFIALSRDVRVLVVKLCDRVHNMRTIKFQSKAKQKSVAIETLEIYAPLAEKMGMYSLKDELQDLSFACVHARARNVVVHRLEMLQKNYMKEHNGSDVVDVISKELKNVLKKDGIECDVYGRIKRPYSIWVKLQKKNTSFNNISDVVAFRVIVKNVKDCYTAIGSIHQKYKAVPNSFSDYISTPKANGYQSVHTVVVRGGSGQRVEIQVRTEKMHKFAEDGFAAHWSYKQDYKNTDIRDNVSMWLKRVMQILQTDDSAEDFLEHAKIEMYGKEILVFDEKGSLFSLRKGACVLDLAFIKGAEIGEKCTGATIDGKMCGIDHRLSNGDKVIIATSQHAFLKEEYLNFVATGLARSAIKNATHKKTKDELVSAGKTILKRALLQHGIGETPSLMQKILNTAGVKKEDDMYVKVAKDEIDICAVIEELFVGSISYSNNDKEVIKQNILKEYGLKMKRKMLINNNIKFHSQHDADIYKINADKSPSHAASNAKNGGAASSAASATPANYHFANPSSSTQSQCQNITGIDRNVVRFPAKCCNPSTDSEIIGVVIGGVGVAVHNKNCQNIQNRKIDKGSVLSLFWSEDVKKRCVDTKKHI